MSSSSSSSPWTQKASEWLNENWRIVLGVTVVAGSLAAIIYQVFVMVQKAERKQRDRIIIEEGGEFVSAPNPYPELTAPEVPIPPAPDMSLTLPEPSLIRSSVELPEILCTEPDASNPPTDDISRLPSVEYEKYQFMNVSRDGSTMIVLGSTSRLECQHLLQIYRQRDGSWHGDSYIPREPGGPSGQLPVVTYFYPGGLYISWDGTQAAVQELENDKMYVRVFDLVQKGRLTRQLGIDSSWGKQVAFLGNYQYIAIASSIRQGQVSSSDRGTVGIYAWNNTDGEYNRTATLYIASPRADFGDKIDTDGTGLAISDGPSTIRTYSSFNAVPDIVQAPGYLAFSLTGRLLVWCTADRVHVQSRGTALQSFVPLTLLRQVGVSPIVDGSEVRYSIVYPVTSLNGYMALYMSDRTVLVYRQVKGSFVPLSGDDPMVINNFGQPGNQTYMAKDAWLCSKLDKKSRPILVRRVFRSVHTWQQQ